MSEAKRAAVSASDKAWSGEERRAHPRSRANHAVALLFGGAWQACEILDVSQGGAAFRSAQRPPLDSEIIVRIAELGLFKCRVLRHLPEGFAARFEAADFGLEPWALETAEPSNGETSREDASASGG